MKNLIIFLGGCFVGACGTFIYLRRDIKKKLDEIEQKSKEDDIPFVCGEPVEEKTESVDIPETVVSKVNSSKPDTHKTNYTSLVRDISIRTGEEATGMDENNYISEKDRFEPVVDRNELNDTLYGREQYVFYEGDQVLSTEAGSIIEKPSMLIGTDWDRYRGIIFENTSLIRDKKRMVICEILVEPGTYSDEYGDIIEIGEE